MRDEADIEAAPQMCSKIAMALGNIETIDSIDVHNPTGDLVLSIFHERPWEEDDHLLLLQSKINTYLAFVCDGQLASDCPEHADRNVRVQIAYKFEPGHEGVQFVEQAKAVLSKHGVSLSVVNGTSL